MFEKLVIWGGGRDLASHRHIHRHFHHAAHKLGIKSVWVPDEPEHRREVTPGSTVISIDIWGSNLPYVNDVDYVLHNFDGSHPLCQQAEPQHLLRLQVWTSDATGEEWDICRRYDKEARTLFQPWGTDLFAEEFMEPVFNPMSRDVTFVGAIWGEKSPYGELGNEATIRELRQVCASRGLTFRHLTHVSDAENVEAVRAARLAPAFAGGWQVQHEYLPCRIFKNISYGALGITNVQAASRLVGEGLADGTVEEILERVLRLKAKDYVAAVRRQQQVVARYTYRQSLESISRALEAGR